jgi:P27 family predicted phage terminase small subunit
MGKRGPAPTPTNLKLLHGETRPSRLNLNEPVPSYKPVEPPDHLTVEARAVWDALAPDLERKGVLTHWDAVAFEVFCDAVAHYREAARDIADFGVMIRGRKDATIKNPAMQMVRDASRTILVFGGRFGLTPADRASLMSGGNETADDREALLS